jgi:hypothetical protein
MSVTSAPNAIQRDICTIVLMRGEHKVDSNCGARRSHRTARIADLHDFDRIQAHLSPDPDLTSRLYQDFERKGGLFVLCAAESPSRPQPLTFLLRSCPQAEPGSRLRTVARGGSYVRTTR